MKILMKKMLYVGNAAASKIDALLNTEPSNFPEPIFIVGAPRSGTTLTYQVVTQQFKVGYFTSQMNYLFGIPNIVMRLLAPFVSRPKPNFRSSYGHINGLFAPSENGNFWFRWLPRDGIQGHFVEANLESLQDYQSMYRSVGSMATILGVPMVFKSVYFSMVIGILAQVFPKARFIFVRRDRLLTCQSLYLARQRRKCPSDWWSV